MSEQHGQAFLVDEPGGEGAGHGDPDQGLKRIGCVFGGIIDEYSRRSKFYKEDWLCGIRNWQVALSATSFMFFATMLPTVALGVSAAVETNGRLGLCEYLISNSLTGVIHAIVGTQPMLIINPTGPITAITGMIGNLADSSEINFYILYSLTGFFIGVWLTIIAAFELSRYVRFMTRFTHEIFACFVCSIMVYQGTDLLLSNFQEDTYGKALFDALCACTTFSLALHFRNGNDWLAFPSQVSRFFADYNLLLPVVFITAISYLPERFAEGTDPQRLQLFENFEPNCKIVNPGSMMTECATTNLPGLEPRPWFVWSLETDNFGLCVIYAALISLPISAFFYVDQNISSLLCQVPEMGLEAGHYFEGSMLCIGGFIAAMPVIGCPMVTGSLPQSPQFVRALTDPTTKRVCESRLAALICHALIAVPLLWPQSLEIIPESAMAGLLMFSGLEGIVLTSVFTRACLTFAPTENLPEDLQNVRMKTFTFLQLALLLGCWTIHSGPPGINLGVAVLIVGLVPIRLLVLPKCFTEAELKILDDPDAGSSVRTKVVFDNKLRGASEANLKWLQEVRETQAGVASMGMEAATRSRASRRSRKSVSNDVSNEDTSDLPATVKA